MSWLVCKRTSNIQHCKSWAGPTSRVSSVCSAPPAGRYWNCACEASALAAGAAHYRTIPGPAPQGCGTYLGPRGNKGAFGPSHLCRDPVGAGGLGCERGRPGPALSGGHSKWSHISFLSIATHRAVKSIVLCGGEWLCPEDHLSIKDNSILRPAGYWRVHCEPSVHGASKALPRRQGALEDGSVMGCG